MFTALKHPRKTLKKFAASKKGSTAIAMAILTPIMVGGLAFGTEFGYWQLKKRQLQNAADTAAYAAGTQRRAGLGNSDLHTAALTVAEESGFDYTRGALAVESPPTAGAYAGNGDAVRVTLTQSVDRRLSKLYTKDPLALPVAATVLIQNGRPACVLALHPSADAAVDVTGSTTVNLTSCDVAANSISDSAFDQGGNGVLSTDCISTVGGAQISKPGNVTLNDCAEPIENTPVTADPYSSRAEPPGHAAMACTNNNEWTKNNGKPDSGKKYCNGANVHNKVTVQVDAANPWIVLSGGKWKFNANAEFTGVGVTLFLTNGAELDINGNAEFNLKAPTSGNYSGLAVFIERTDTQTHKFNGGADISIVGAIYGRDATVEMLGNVAGNGAGECTQIVSGKVKFSGNSDWSSDCSNSGTTEILAAQTLALVE